MAPEQAAADSHIDHRADIYAVGVLAYELLTGRPPFTGATSQEILSAHVTRAPEPVTNYRDTVPQPLAQLVMKCLEKKPADRWQTAEELLPQLEALTTPTLGVTPTDTSPLQAAVRGKKVKIGVIGGAIAAAVVVGVFLLLPGRGSALEPDRVVVAILDNETGDPRHDALGKMAQDWLTQGLLQTGIVRVVPTPDARQASAFVQSEIAAGRRLQPVQALAEETGAGTVVWGAIYREGENLLFQLSVTDARAGELVGALDPVAGPPDSASSTIGAMREQLMGFLAARLDERLAGFATASASAPTFEAYQAFSEGMDAYIRYDNAGALPYFLRAYELDSSYVTSLLFAGINLANLGRWAEADSLLGVLDRKRDRLSEYDRLWVTQTRRGYVRGQEESGLIAIRRAAEMAPGSKAVYNLGLQARIAERPHEAVAALRSLDPDRGPMRGWYNYWIELAWSLHHLGEDEAALEELRKGRERHPDVPVLLLEELVQLGVLGRLDEVFDLLKSEGSLLPPEMRAQTMFWVRAELEVHDYPSATMQMNDSALVWFEGRPADEREETWYRRWGAEALSYAGRNAEAIAQVAGLERDRPNEWLYRALRGGYQALAGDTAPALQVARWLEDLEDPYARGRDAFYIANIMQALGRWDEAYSALQRAFSSGGEWINIHPYVTPQWRREDPRAEELLRPKG